MSDNGLTVFGDSKFHYKRSVYERVQYIVGKRYICKQSYITKFFYLLEIRVSHDLGKLEERPIKCKGGKGKRELE